MELRLATRAWLWALLAVPLAGFAMYWLERKLAPTLRFPGLKALAKLPLRTGEGMGAVSKALKLLVLALLVLAIARPQWVKAHVKIFSEGIDIVITLDLSTSMNAADFQPKDRVTVAKEVVKEFIAQRKNDRIGLVVFSKEAYTQSPLTLDYTALTNIVSTLRTGAIEDGTAIGNALAVSTNRLRAAGGKSRVIVLVTDGDNNAGNIAPLEAADLAKQNNVRVFTILVGRDGPVPFPVGKNPLGVTRYENVEIPINPALLRQIAERTGGKAYAATNGDELKAGLKKVLDEMEKTRFAETSSYEQIVELAPFVAFAALFLLIIDLLLGLSIARKFPV
jgi:Ca-activated chloride channel family protein